MSLVYLVGMYQSFEQITGDECSMETTGETDLLRRYIYIYIYIYIYMIVVDNCCLSLHTRE
jgi:hypothetical protein